MCGDLGLVGGLRASLSALMVRIRAIGTVGCHLLNKKEPQNNDNRRKRLFIDWSVRKKVLDILCLTKLNSIITCIDF